ncbi:hypothetical protein EYZ11_003821 [Aspergillus tanneri]|nr:hypothetical protein EYZ11_003821 [Aspergillus tanneri]
MFQDVEDTESLMSLRANIDNDKLIYDPHSEKRYPRGQCIWAPTRIGNQIGLSEIYPDLEEFFVDRLLIKPPSLDTYFSQLKSLSTENSVKYDDVITAIRNINDFNPTELDLEPLKAVQFLPVNRHNQSLEVSYVSTAEEFFIVDRDGWPALFYEKVPTLSMSLDEIRGIRPFLNSLGLDKRFISTAAVKKTAVYPRPTESAPGLTREFREKARLLCRCAVYYSGVKSIAAEEIYNIYRNARVYKSAYIAAIYSLQLQSGEHVSVDAYSRLHVEYSNEQLDLFVPSDANERRICYSGQLPETLTNYLPIKNPVARGTFTTILQQPLDVSNSILAEDGIPELPKLELISPVVAESEHSGDESLEETSFTPTASMAEWHESHKKARALRDDWLSKRSNSNASTLKGSVDSENGVIDNLQLSLRDLKLPGSFDP